MFRIQWIHIRFEFTESIQPNNSDISKIQGGQDSTFNKISSFQSVQLFSIIFVAGKFEIPQIQRSVSPSSSTTGLWLSVNVMIELCFFLSALSAERKKEIALNPLLPTPFHRCVVLTATVVWLIP